MDRIGKYRIKPFSKNRQNITLIVHEGWRRHSAHGLIEIDVTNALKMINKYKKKTETSISFTGWVIKCIGQALSEHKELNSLRHGRKKLVIFDDIDVAIPVERSAGDETRPMAYIIRRVNEKSVLDITKEIRKVQNEEVDGSTQLLGKNLTRLERFTINSPMFIKKFLLWLVRRNAFLTKKYMGTIGVTSIGMKGRFPGWIVPLGATTTILFVLTGVTKKPIAVEDKIVAREHLGITISVDHDIIDGGPMARFVDRLIELVEKGYGLSEI